MSFYACLYFLTRTCFSSIINVCCLVSRSPQQSLLLFPIVFRAGRRNISIKPSGRLLRVVLIFTLDHRQVLLRFSLQGKSLTFLDFILPTVTSWTEHWECNKFLLFNTNGCWMTSLCLDSGQRRPCPVVADSKLVKRFWLCRIERLYTSSWWYPAN